MRRLTLITLAIVVAGCATKTATGPVATAAPATTSDSTIDTPEATPADEATITWRVGDPIRITCGGEDCLDVTVLQVKFATGYGSGYMRDAPRKGHVYAAVQVRYKAVMSGADYNPWDWQLFVNDEAISEFAYLVSGPAPELSAGTLPKGKSVTGWVVWEVPKSGRVVIAYGGSVSQAPVFEIILRH